MFRPDIEIVTADQYPNNYKVFTTDEELRGCDEKSKVLHLIISGSGITDKWIDCLSEYTNLKSLTVFECFNLTNLGPILPSCEELICSNNRLERLPALPNCKRIECEGNKLRELPHLPKCESIKCVEYTLAPVIDFIAQKI